MYISAHRSAIGRHIEQVHFQAIASTKDRFPVLEIIQIDSLFVLASDL